MKKRYGISHRETECDRRTCCVSFSARAAASTFGRIATGCGSPHGSIDARRPDARPFGALTERCALLFGEPALRERPAALVAALGMVDALRDFSWLALLWRGYLGEALASRANCLLLYMTRLNETDELSVYLL